MKFKSRRGGFTLIELLVVISIISLLSSVILASVKEAKEKAQIKAFRSEVQQLINALELYRSDNANYPGQDYGIAYYRISQTGGISPSPADFDFKTLLSSYIALIPKPKIPGGSAITNALWYRVNNPVLSSIILYRCVGDTNTPPYLIYFVNASNFTVPGFEDWPRVEYSQDNWATVTSFPYSRCFSNK